MRTIIMGAVAVLLAACNPVANLNGAEEKIAEFHDLYARGEDDALYQFVSPELRKVTTRAQFQDLLDVVKGRLGAIESSERTNFNVNSNPGGTFTVIQMQTAFEQGEGVEVFTFKGHGDDIELVGWNVNSPRLLYTADDLAGPVQQDSETTD